MQESLRHAYFGVRADRIQCNFVLVRSLPLDASMGVDRRIELRTPRVDVPHLGEHRSDVDVVVMCAKPDRA